MKLKQQIITFIEQRIEENKTIADVYAESKLHFNWEKWTSKNIELKILLKEIEEMGE